MKRETRISKASSTEFDIAIIGGGITGAGIFELAGQLGYHCVLLEKGDFAQGTSSKSAKMIHGGARYLQYGQFKMVREGLTQRNRLLDQYPELVKPLEFIMPLYGSRAKYIAGMYVYEWLSKDGKIPSFKYLSKEKTLRELPFIEQENLKGGIAFYDGITNDALLCNEVIHRSMELTGNIALNYTEVIGGKAENDFFKLQCINHIQETKLQVSSRYIINASGVWMDEILNKISGKNEITSSPSKGIHIVLSKKRLPLNKATLFPSFDDDKRTLYALPWENDSLIVGTTDTEGGNIDKPIAGKDDIRYVLNALNKYIPGEQFTEKDILYTFAGFRPLIKDDVESKDRTREYKIWWSDDQILNILGGKLTSFQSMAERVMEAFHTKVEPVQSKQKVKAKKVKSKAERIAEIESENVAYKELATDEIDIKVSELIYYIRYRSCELLDDLLLRRFALKFILNRFQQKEAIVRKVTAIMQKEKGWSNDEADKQLKQFLNDLNQIIPHG